MKSQSCKLPNLKGYVAIGNNGYACLCYGGTGAFRTNNLAQITRIFTTVEFAEGMYRQDYFNFDASWYNPIYDQSINRVIPYSLKTLYYIKF